MKKYLILTISLLFFTISFAQKITYQESLQYAMAKSSVLKKKLLVIIDVENSSIKARQKSFEDVDIINAINQDYIVYQTTFQDNALRESFKYYGLCNCPTILFLKPNLDLFYKTTEFDYSKEKLLKIIAIANTISDENNPMELHRMYNKDTSNVQILKKLIDTRKIAGITNNAYFIEKYVSFLTESDLNDYKTILYILESGPRLGALAYRKAYSRRYLVDSIYKTEPKEKLAVMTTAATTNTMDIAIKIKCVDDAINVANYFKNAPGNDEYSGKKVFNEKMLQYYRSIRDTSNYYQLALAHYNYYYMSVNQNQFKKIKAYDDSDKSTIKTTWKAQSYPENLNNAAWFFYTSKTENLKHLNNAIRWSNHSIKLMPKAIYYNTLAHLFYKISNFKKAEKAMEVAIDLAKSEDISVVNFKNSLLMMKNKTL